ncbi:MAG: hypothetical protein WCE90_08710 [Candidatus Zixiibacteriota bacterium]
MVVGVKKTLTRAILLTILVYFPLAETHPAASVRSQAFKDHVISSVQPEHSQFLLAQQTQDSTATKKTASLKTKSPYMAIFYSVIPGVAIHGAGHIYAGKTGTGLRLLGCELLGGGLLFMGGLIGLGSGVPSAGGENVQLVGFCLFLGSWVYDVIGAPLAVQKQNEVLLQRGKLGHFNLQMKDRNLKVLITWRF